MPQGPSIKSKTLDESASNNAFLTLDTLGYHPGGLYSQHAIACDNLGGGTWSVLVMGPGGVFLQVATGLTTEILQIGPRFSGVVGGSEIALRFRAQEIRIDFAGGGGASKIHVQSELTSR